MKNSSIPMAAPPAAVERLLTPADLADLLQLPVQTLAVWRSAGEGPAYHRVGKHVRYSVPDVTAWLSARRAA